MFNQPDIVILGIHDRMLTHGIAVAIFETTLKIGKPIPMGEFCYDRDRFIITEIPYDAELWQDTFGMGMNICEEFGLKPPFPRMAQVFWPDKNGKFPWEVDYCVPLDIQLNLPLLATLET